MIDSTRDLMKNGKYCFKNKFGFIVKVCINGFFGNTHLIGYIVHSNTLKTKVQE